MAFQSPDDHSPLYSTAVSLAGALPVLGDAAGPRYMFLAHFSENDAIQEFEAGNEVNCTWTNYLAAGVERIERATGCQAPFRYKAVYIVKIGLANGRSWNQAADIFAAIKARPCGKEFSLVAPVLAGQFVKIPLTFDSGTNTLKP